MSPLGVVFLKETVDALRDRRSMLSLLLFPLVGPILVALALWLTTSEITRPAQAKLPVVGAEHAPGLIAFLREHEVAIEPPPVDLAAAVTSGEVDAVLVIPRDYAARFRESRAIVVDLVSDSSRTSARGTTLRVERLIEGYAKRVGTLRLLARGVSPSVAAPLEVRAVDASTPERRAALFLHLVPMFVLIAAFVGGMYVATDVTAGERERGSLEPLLLTPASRRAITHGKWLTTVCFSGATVLLTLLLTLVALSFVPLDQLGISLSLGAFEIAAILLSVLPLTLFVAALQLLVASFAKSFKEAQTYLSLMMLVPTLPAIVFGIGSIEARAWMYPIPLLGQEALLIGVIRGEAVPPLGFALALIGSLAGAGVTLWLTERLFRSERVVAR